MTPIIRRPARLMALLALGTALTGTLPAPAYATDSATVVATAPLSHAEVAWRAGDMQAAQTEADRAVARNPGFDSWMAKGRLSDAQGRNAIALSMYQKALAAPGHDRDKAALRLRIALMDAVRKPDLLRDRAGEFAPPMRNRTALLLALLGAPGDALALSASDAPHAYEPDIQRAGWALAAGRFDIARDHAWRAYGETGDKSARRYALALLIEAFRSANNLEGAVAFLASQPLSPDLMQARLDLMLEMERYDDAIAIVRESSDPDMRQQLLSILSLADRKPALIAEYRHMIVAQPDNPDPVRGLALIHLGDSNPAAAEALYRQYFAAKKGDLDQLTQAARDMIAMGLDDVALEVMGRIGNDPAFASKVDMFLVEAYRNRGEDGKALSMLEHLQATMPADAIRRIDMADAYEALGRPDLAFQLLTALESRRPALDYDQRVHIATLAFKLDHKQDALARWRRLWATETLPARRSYLEKQIIRVADAMGQLPLLANEVETRLTSGGAPRNELDLLIGIRLAQHNRAGAVAAINRFAGSGALSDVARLEQLAMIYVRLDDHAALDRTLEQLLLADPANAEGYLRRLTLNAVRFPNDEDAQQKRIDTLLDRLRRTAHMPPMEFARFAGGVYSSAAQNDRAIGQYRTILAIAPDDIENLVQLADLLSRQGQRAQAVAMLQYEAEHARDANHFVAAIDGLLDIVSQPSTEGNAAQLVRATLPWAKRLILEHMTVSGGDMRLETLLTDVAQQQGDFAQQMRAYDEILVVAGDQRPSVLRQLITLASGSARAEIGGGPSLGDPGRKLTYGRRLLAMRKDYPPELYADLGQALLAQGDVSGAERAFAMIGDTGGLVNIDRLKGEAYAQAGLVDQALGYYSRALLRDRNDLDLALRTSILREQTGDATGATNAYWQALRGLILRQPMAGAGGEDNQLDNRQYSASLIEGLLLNLPHTPTAQPGILAELDRMLADCLAGVDPAAHRPFSAYGRLSFVARINRRLSDRLNAPARIAAMDQSLRTAFDSDATFRKELATYDDMVGRRVPIDDADWASKSLREQARDADDQPQYLSIILAQHDVPAIRAFVAEAIAMETAHRASPKSAESGPSPLFGLLAQSEKWLDPADLRTLVLSPIDATPFRDDILFQLFRADPGTYRNLTRLMGRPLVQSDAFLNLMAEHDMGPLPYWGALRPQRFTVTGLTDLLADILSHDQLMSLYEKLVAHMEESGARSFWQETLVMRFLNQPLNDADQARLASGIGREIAYSRDDDARSGIRMIPRLLALDTPPANRGLLVRLADALAARYADSRSLPLLLRAWFAGDSKAAYRHLLALSAATRTNARGVDYATPLINAHFQAETGAEIDRFLSGPVPTQDIAATFYRDQVAPLLTSSDTAAKARLPAYYARLLSADPDNITYLGGQLNLLWDRRDMVSLTDALAQYVQRHAEDDEAATMLQLLFILQENAGAAQSIANAIGVDANDPSWLVEMINRTNSRQQGNVGPDMHMLFRKIYDLWRTRAPQTPAIVEAERRQALAQAERTDPAAASFDAIFAHGPDAAAAQLRGRWRQSIGASQEVNGAMRDRFLRLMPDPDRPEDQAIVTRMAATPGLRQEVDAYLAAMSPQDRMERSSLYRLLAALVDLDGHGVPEIASLSDALNGQDMSMHRLYLLVALIDRMPDPIGSDLLSRTTARLQAMPALAPAMRIILARIYARAADYDVAQDQLLAAAYQLRTQTIPDDQASTLLADMVAALARWRDTARAGQVYDRIRQYLETDAKGGDSRRPPLPPFAPQAGR